MPLGEARTEQFVEAFEVLGKRAPTVDRETMGSIMRALGQNPTNDEVKGLFESGWIPCRFNPRLVSSRLGRLAGLASWAIGG